MAERTGTEGETPEQVNGTEGETPETSTGTVGTTPVTTDALQAEVARLNRIVQMAKSEAHERRKRLEDLEKAETERAQATLTETEKLKAQLAEIAKERESIAAELHLARVKSAVVSKANELGFASPEDAYTLIDLSAIEVNEDGKVTGYEKALEALAKSGRLPMKTAAAQAPGTPPRRTGVAAGATPPPQPAPVSIRI